MIDLTLKRTIPAPIEKVWEVLADFGGVYKFNPMVRTSRITNGQAEGVGAQRRCDFTGRNGFAVERINELREPGHMVIELLEGTMPFKRAFAIYTLDEKTDSLTDLKLVMQMEPKGGAMGRMMAKYMMVPMMKGKLADVLKGLDHYVCNGEKLAA